MSSGDIAGRMGARDAGSPAELRFGRFPVEVVLTEGRMGSVGMQISIDEDRQRSPRRRGNLHQESTRVRSNVADQMQRDFVPVGRMLSILLVTCEFFAEVLVLDASREQECDRPLRFWVELLMVLQAMHVALNLVGIWGERESGRLTFTLTDGEGSRGTDGTVPLVANDQTARTPLQESLNAVSSSSRMNDAPGPEVDPTVAGNYGLNEGGLTVPLRSRDLLIDKWLRIVRACYLVWYIMGSVWVSNGGMCTKTAPHLYRLVLALTIIYYIVQFLPLGCFVLIVCCLPLFMLLCRILLPYAERERRGARTEQIQSLHCVPYTPGSFGSADSGRNGLAEPDNEASCVICLCAYEEGEKIAILPCKHHFHHRCIGQWLRIEKSCPLCKADIDAVRANEEAANSEDLPV